MKRIYIILSFFCFAISQDNYWQQTVHYNMDVKLDIQNHNLVGTSQIRYTNHSDSVMQKMFLHLYPNAFQVGSVKYQDAQKKYSTWGITENVRSGIEIYSVKIHDQEKPDYFSANFKVEDTILSFPLSQRLNPGESVDFSIEWLHKVRKRLGRMGYENDHYDFAQWYPKLCVYDEKGWHNEPMHAVGEFYGEFATFDVKIDVPKRLILCATGEPIEGNPGWEIVRVDTSQNFAEWLKQFQSSIFSELNSTPDSLRRIVTWHAENVHDFAWNASNTFLYESGEWNGIKVHVLYDQNVGKQWTKRVVDRSESALEWLSTKIGMYPYPQITTVKMLRGGGMEYPMLVMNGSASESLIVHEIGHNFFYGILANDEVNEAWLDEGFTTWQTRWYMETKYPPYGIERKNQTQFQKIFSMPLTRTERSQNLAFRYILSGFNEPIATTSHLFVSPGSYRQNAYKKPSLMLQALREGVLNPTIFDDAMQVYYDRWMLKHTNESRFRSVMEEISGNNLSWFFDEWLHETGWVDYSLKKWQQKNDQLSVYIQQNGTYRMPVKVLAISESGDSLWGKWDVRKSSGDKILIPTSETIKTVQIDPFDQIFDFDRRNNSKPQISKYYFRPMNLGGDTAPSDGKLVRVFPYFWLNSADGLISGLQFSTNYRKYFENNNYAIYFGHKSGKIDFDFSRELYQPFLFRGNSLKITGTKGQGRFRYSLHAQKILQKRMEKPPKTTFYADLDFIGIQDTTYLNPDFWDLKIQQWTIFSVGAHGNYRTMTWRYNWRTDLRLHRDFQTLRLSHTSQVFWKWFDFRSRIFAATIHGIAPKQEEIGLSCGNGWNRFENKIIRTADMLGDLYYLTQYHNPGGANIRLAKPAGYTSCLALNSELTRDHLVRWFDMALNRVTGGQEYYIFCDAALMEKSWNYETFLDLGIGFTFYNIFHTDLDIRIDGGWTLIPEAEFSEPGRIFSFSTIWQKR